MLPLWFPLWFPLLLPLVLSLVLSLLRSLSCSLSHALSPQTTPRNDISLSGPLSVDRSPALYVLISISCPLSLALSRAPFSDIFLAPSLSRTLPPPLSLSLALTCSHLRPLALSRLLSRDHALYICLSATLLSDVYLTTPVQSHPACAGDRFPHRATHRRRDAMLSASVQVDTRCHLPRWQLPKLPEKHDDATAPSDVPEERELAAMENASGLNRGFQRGGWRTVFLCAVQGHSWRLSES